MKNNGENPLIFYIPINVILSAATGPPKQACETFGTLPTSSSSHCHLAATGPLEHGSTYQ